MDINDIPRGQLSTIILTSLLNGDKYGYEIISDVEEKTKGELVIKKPSLYSALSRMENQDLVSSYWKDSEIGGRRHYYRLTDYGRKQVHQWQEDLLNSQTKVSKILNDKNSDESEKNESNISKDTIVHQENLFGVLNNKEESKSTDAVFTETKKDVFLQYDLFDSNFISTPAESDFVPKQEIQPTVFNMSAFNQSEDINENKEIELNINDTLPDQIRIEDKLDTLQNHDSSSPKVEIGNFDIEDELNRYKKNIKSYAEDMSSTQVKSYINYDYIYSPIENSFEVEEKAGFELPVNQDDNNQLIDNEVQNNDELVDNLSHETKKEEQTKSDAVYITDVLNEEDFKVKKIEPASFAHLGQSTNIKKSQKTISQNEIDKKNSTETYYEDYSSLKQYFKKMDINLKVYGEKQELEINRNIILKLNQFKFYSYLIFFILMTVEILSTYLVLNFYNLLSDYHIIYLAFYEFVGLIPLIYFSYKLIKYPNKYVDKSSIKLNPIWFKLCLIILATAIIYCLNSIFGMNLVNIKYYITTTILPTIIIFNFIFVHLYKYFCLKNTKN